MCIVCLLMAALRDHFNPCIGRERSSCPLKRVGTKDGVFYGVHGWCCQECHNDWNLVVNGDSRTSGNSAGGADNRQDGVPEPEVLQPAESQVETAYPDNRRDCNGGQNSNPELVLNELLCFCFNMLNSMAQSLLLKVCADFYDEDIDAAKEELSKYNVNDSLKARLLKKRRGADKKSTVMNDILDTIRGNDPSVFPVYVARSLGNVPPLTKSCVNMASIMVELTQLRSDVNSVQRLDGSLSELTETVRAMKHQLDGLSSVRCNDHKELDRTDALDQNSVPDPSSPTGLSDNAHPSSTDSFHLAQSPVQTTANCVTFRDAPPVTRLLTETVVKARIPAPGPDALSSNRDRDLDQKSRGMNFAAAVQSVDDKSAGQTVNRPDNAELNDGFITVGPKGRPLRSLKARSAASSDLKLKPQRPRKSDVIYLSNVNPDIDNDGLREEIKRRLGINVRCKRLNPDMVDPDFASFQVFVQPDHAAMILDKSNWPSWIIVRSWEKRSRKSRDARRVDNLPLYDTEPQRIQTIVGVRKPSTPMYGRHDLNSGSIYCTPENWYDHYDESCSKKF